MAGLVPAIHDLIKANKTWMPGTRPGMTGESSGTMLNTAIVGLGWWGKTLVRRRTTSARRFNSCAG